MPSRVPKICPQIELQRSTGCWFHFVHGLEYIRGKLPWPKNHALVAKVTTFVPILEFFLIYWCHFSIIAFYRVHRDRSSYFVSQTPLLRRIHRCQSYKTCSLCTRMFSSFKQHSENLDNWDFQYIMTVCRFSADSQHILKLALAFSAQPLGLKVLLYKTLNFRKTSDLG